MATRRSVLQATAGGVALAGSGLFGRLASADLPRGTTDSRRTRGPAGQTPAPEPLVPPAELRNADRLLQRRHYAQRTLLRALAPSEYSTGRYRVLATRVGGDSAATGFELTLNQLKNEFEPAELVAVCQCSGNRRGLSDPHVAG